jgi:hypothetical protein
VVTQAQSGIDYEYVYERTAGYKTYKQFFGAYCMPHFPLYDHKVVQAVRTKGSHIKGIFDLRSPPRV